MTTGLSYDGSIAGTAGFVTQLAELAVAPASDINFQTILPAAITYAENRIYRDLDLLSAVAPFYSAAETDITLAAGNRFLSLPVDTFMTVQGVSVITPAGSSVWSGTRTPLLPVTREFIDNVYGASGTTGAPQYFAVLSQGTDPATSLFSFQLVFGPTPDQAYAVDVMGTRRPTSLSSGNQVTFISKYLPDLMLMAAMVYVSGYQRNWSGASANDPQMPINYETQYHTLLKSAVGEEARKKFQASGWTALSPAPAATPTRG